MAGCGLAADLIWAATEWIQREQTKCRGFATSNGAAIARCAQFWKTLWAHRCGVVSLDENYSCAGQTRRCTRICRAPPSGDC